MWLRLSDQFWIVIERDNQISIGGIYQRIPKGGLEPVRTTIQSPTGRMSLKLDTPSATLHSGALEVFKDHPNFTPGVDELLDFTLSSLAWMSPDDVQGMRRSLQEQPERHNCKSAIVVNTKLEYGLARMMDGTMAMDVPTNRGVFYSVNEALDWLRPDRAEELQRIHHDASGKSRSA